MVFEIRKLGREMTERLPNSFCWKLNGGIPARVWRSGVGIKTLTAGPPQGYAAQYRDAVKILDAISKESGSTHVLARADLKDISRKAVQWSQ